MPVQNYTLFASVDGGEYKLVRTLAASVTSYDFTNWFLGEVTFKVAAKSNNGWSRVRDALDPATLLPTPVDVTIIDGNNEPPPEYEDPGIPPATEPKTPFSLTAEAVESSKSIKLKWSETTDDEKGFIIQREASNDGFVEIARVGVDVETYTDGTAERGVKYTYRIIAYNDAGYSQPSNDADATLKLEKPSGLTATAPNPTEVNLTWTDNSKHESGFVIEWRVAGETYWGGGLAAAMNATGWSITGLSSETDYQFRIKAIGEKESDWSGIDDERTPEIPAGDIIGEATPSISDDTVSWFDGGAAQPAGSYIIRYMAGGLDYGDVTPVLWRVNYGSGYEYRVDHDDGADGAAPGYFGDYDSVGDLEEANAGASTILTTGTSNPIGVHLADSPYDNPGDPFRANNGPGATFRLELAPAVPTVSITATDEFAIESATNSTANTARFRVERATGNMSEPLTVYLHPPAGIAKNSTDYLVKIGDSEFEALGGQVTIPANEYFIDIVLKASKDNLNEPTESVVLHLKADQSYRLVPGEAKAVASIKSLAVFVQVAMDAEENGFTSVVKVERSNDDLTDPLEVAFTVGGTAVEGIDYLAVPRTVTIPAGEISAFIDIEPMDDDEVEFSETVEITLTDNPSNSYEIATAPRSDRWFQHKKGFARGYLDDDETGSMYAFYPPAPTMNSLEKDERQADSSSGDNCQSWAFNSQGTGKKIDFKSAVYPFAVIHGLLDGDTDPSQNDLLINPGMMKRMLEAMLYSPASPVRGYRCYFDTPIPASTTTPTTYFHRITAYHRQLSSQNEYHYATEDRDPNTGLWTWSDKEGEDTATNTDPYSEFGTFLGHYMINTAPRDARATP